MRLPVALVVLSGLSLAVSGCDKPSGDGAQGGPSSANASPATTPDEVTSDEVAPRPAGDTGKPFQHVVDRSHKGELMPDKPFKGQDGKAATLKQLAGGKPMLVNLWATWCAPCVAELPALDQLAAASGLNGVKVVAISQDLQTDAVAAFWAARKLSSLKTWLDPENALGFHYGTGTLPTTILYDAKGREAVRIVGALDWNGPEGQKLLAGIAVKPGM